MRGMRALLLFFGAAILFAQPSVRVLTADQLKEMVDAKARFFFVDVREPKELEELGTLRGFANIPLGQVAERLSEIPKDQPILPACNRAVRASEAAAILLKNGYNVVGAVGMLEWRDRGYPLVFPRGKKIYSSAGSVN